MKKTKNLKGIIKMKKKKAGRYVLILSVRMIKIICCLVCWTMLLLLLCPAQKATFAYSYTTAQGSITNDCLTRVELFGRTYAVDTTLIKPIAGKIEDYLSVNEIYLSALARTCLKFLTETFGAVAGRVSAFLPSQAKYSGSASMA